MLNIEKNLMNLTLVFIILPPICKILIFVEKILQVTVTTPIKMILAHH